MQKGIEFGNLIYVTINLSPHRLSHEGYPMCMYISDATPSVSVCTTFVRQ